MTERWDDAKALASLENECASCHGVDAKRCEGRYHSAWPLAPEGITRAFLEVSELTPIAYPSLRHAALNAGTAPAPMPPKDFDDTKRAEPRIMIDWFQRAVPYAVIDADARSSRARPRSLFSWHAVSTRLRTSRAFAVFA